MGDTALLVSCDGPLQAAALAALFREASGGGMLSPLVDVVPAARTVLLVAEPGALDVAAVEAFLSARAESGDATSGPVGSHGGLPELRLPVRLDGPDLALTAEVTGLGVDGLANRFFGVIWTVAFTGFAPGFGYCVGGDLDVPRLDEPRTRVPAGSVALAGPYAGVYPRASPGGWRIVGTVTDDVPAMFDADRDPPALLAPGRQVRFVAAG